MNFWGVILSVVVVFVVEARAQRNPTGASVYDNCGQRNKKCFGDTDACVEGRNCTYAVSLTENRTHIDLILLNNCAEPNKTIREYFVGVGLTTTDSQGTPECREPVLDDFKVFILWNKIKCHRKAFFYSEVRWQSTSKVNWKSNCEYGNFVNGSRPRENFDLGRYIQNNIRIASGDTQAPFNFVDRVDYIVKDRSLYINRYPGPEPQESGFDYRPSNNNMNHRGQPSNSESKADEEDKNGGVMSIPNILYLMSLLTIVLVHQ